MKHALIEAFGSKGYLCKAAPTGAVRVPLNADGEYDIGAFFIIDGSAQFTAPNGTREFPLRTAGHIINGNSIPAPGETKIMLTFPDGCRWFCIPDDENDSRPSLEAVLAQDGDTVPLETGDRVLLLKGDLVIGSQTFSPPSSLVCSTRAMTATAVGEVVALRFL
jgi:hypothetical protein